MLWIINFDRLKDDHQKAKDIAGVLANTWKRFLVVEPVETNIVIFKLNSSIPEGLIFRYHLKAHDVLVSDMGSGKLRMVTHLDYTDAMHTRSFRTIDGSLNLFFVCL